MINALDACLKTKHKAEINLVKEQIEKGIKNAIERGEYACDIDIGSGTPQYVRDEIEKWLSDLMYRVDIPKYESQHGCPADQMTYWNTVHISWESEASIRKRELRGSVEKGLL